MVEAKVTINLPTSGSGFDYAQAGLLIYGDDSNSLRRPSQDKSWRGCGLLSAPWMARNCMRATQATTIRPGCVEERGRIAEQRREDRALRGQSLRLYCNLQLC